MQPRRQATRAGDNEASGVHHDVPGKQVQPVAHRVDAIRDGQGSANLVDQRGRQVPTLGGNCVPVRLLLMPMLTQPFRRAQVDGRDLAGLGFLGKPLLEGIGEEMVVAQPLALRSQGDDEQVALPQVAQVKRAVVSLEIRSRTAPDRGKAAARCGGERSVGRRARRPSPPPAGNRRFSGPGHRSWRRSA